ncbi:hypothetical protein [Kitasatospora griseola]|uniref:hypothetical protein n=1 Tax=Kitasatospora griseola TaxID=2064 RepID=UPI003447BCB9
MAGAGLAWAGVGRELRTAVLHLAFAGLGAREAEGDAFVENHASNKVSRVPGYEPNGTTWDTRHGEAAPIQRRRLTRDAWERTRRDDIELMGVQACLPGLGLPQGWASPDRRPRAEGPYVAAPRVRCRPGR